MKQLHSLLVLLVLIPTSITAQTTGRHWLALETDPFTTAFGARTISLMVEPQGVEHWSFFANAVQADFPDWMDDFLNPRNNGKMLDARIAAGGGIALEFP